MKEYLTAREVAQAFGKSKEWAIKMVQRGKLKAYRFGHMLAIARSDFEEFKKAYEEKQRERKAKKSDK
jgi:excisionase family DNA binding protein